MKAVVDGQVYRYWFRRVDDLVPLAGGTLTRKKMVTVCRIEQEGSGRATQAEAVCSAGDAFCKETGRKVSLTRALRRLWPSFEHREQRRQFWEDYHARGVRP